MVTVPSLVDETPLDQYTATASQTDFNFTYMIFATEDIKVYVNDVLKTETTDYVVKQSDGSAIVPADDLPMDGGKVVFNSGLTSGDKVSLSRDIAIERLTGYSVAGAFRADVVNAEFTKIYAVQQQLERDLARTVRLSASDAEGGSLTLPSNRASQFLAFDANGDMIASAGSADSITVSTFMATVLDDTTAAAARTTLDCQEDVITTRGDIIKGSSSAAAERLAIGAANYLLKSDGTDPSWGFEVLDEDDMSSDSATKLASQQSIKAYADSLRDWEKISSANASSSSSIDFTGLSSSYCAYKLIFTEVIPATDNTDLLLRTSADGGSTYDSGASDYGYVRYLIDFTSPSTNATGSNAVNGISLFQAAGNNTAEFVSGEATILNPSATTSTVVLMDVFARNQVASEILWKGQGYRNSEAAVDAIRIVMSSGNIASGKFTLYGLKA